MLQIIFSVFLSLAACASGNSLTKKDIVDRQNIQSLHGSANLLMALADHSVKLDCPISSEEALRLINPLHALIDERVQVESELALKNPKEYWDRRSIDTCEQRCECGLWVKVFENAPKAFGLKKVEGLRAKAAAQKPSALETCVKDQRWFCKSELRDFLAQELKK